MGSPLVSVIVPNYNHAAFLPRRLESVLAQTFSDFEVVALDDASQDNSLEVLRRYASDPRVRLLANRENSGSPFVQWNRGVARARGELVWIAESDDYADPQLLEKLLARMSADCALAYADSICVDRDGNEVSAYVDAANPIPQPERWRTAFVNDGRDECGRFLLWRNMIPNASGVLFRRRAYLEAGGAPEDMRLCGDWLTWARVLTQGAVSYTPERLNYFRQHGGSVRSTTSWRQYVREKWATQEFIVRSARVPFAMRRELARRVVGDVFTVALPSPRGTRLSTFATFLGHAAPLLRRTPFTAASAVAARVLRSASKRVVPRSLPA